MHACTTTQFHYLLAILNAIGSGKGGAMGLQLQPHLILRVLHRMYFNFYHKTESSVQ